VRFIRSSKPEHKGVSSAHSSLHVLGPRTHLQIQLSESVVSTGMQTVSTGTDGRYLATSLAVTPSLVITMMSDARTCTAPPPPQRR
jgi:hypothetical protein